MQSATALSSNRRAVLTTSTELRILLVDDSLPLQERLREQLTDPGVMRVTATAESEQEANRLLDTQSFDVLVIDIELRPGSGINVVLHARKLAPCEPRPLIIVLTNYALATVRSRSVTAGADYFLDKMREFDQLYAIIRNHQRPH
jgi:DNA-binding response OmpR family regulator